MTHSEPWMELVLPLKPGRPPRPRPLARALNAWTLRAISWPSEDAAGALSVASSDGGEGVGTGDGGATLP